MKVGEELVRLRQKAESLEDEVADLNAEVHSLTDDIRSSRQLRKALDDLLDLVEPLAREAADPPCDLATWLRWRQIRRACAQARELV